MDSLEIIITTGVSIVLGGLAGVGVAEMCKRFTAMESRRERKWARELEKDEDAVLAKMSATSQLLYKGIKACEDGKVPTSLYFAYSGWQDHATEMEQYVLKHAYSEAKKREKMHDIMVMSTNGWNDASSSWTNATIVSSHPGLNALAANSTFNGPSLGSLMKQQDLKTQQLIQTAKELGVYSNGVDDK